MERLKVYCMDSCAGEAVIERRDGRAEICVTMKDPGDGLYRAVLVGESGELALGVLEPRRGALRLGRKPYARDVERLGKLKGVQAKCSFVFPQKCAWQKTFRAGELVNSAFLRERLSAVSRAWWRREGKMLILALPLKRDEPFPLECMFCFGKIGCVEGERCVIYTLDGQDMPV